MRLRRYLAIFVAVIGPGFSIFAQTVITAEPVGQTNVVIGQPVSFSIGVRSTVTTNLIFQWKINGVNIPGATNSTLQFSNIQPTNGGEISVVVSDGLTAMESPYVPLTFSVPFLAGKIFSNRLALTPIYSGMITSENVAATGDSNNPVVVSDAPGGKGGRRIWFSWTPGANGIATFTTLGSGFETILGVYTGTELTNLLAVPSAINDDDGAGNLNSRIMFNAVANTQYAIAVDGYWGAYGNVLLSWNEEITYNILPTFASMPRPRTVLFSGAPVSFAAHWDVGECDWFFNGQDTTVETNTIAVTDIAPTNVGKYVIQVTADNGVDTTIARAARLELNVLDDGTTATTSFAWPKFLDAANNPFTPPTVSPVGPRPQGGGDTRGYSVSQVFSTVGDSSEPGEPSVCGQIPAHPAWYVYVAPTNGMMLINTTGSTFNTVLGAFVGPGTSFSTLTNIGCGYTTNFAQEGQPQVLLSSVPAGQTNYIVVDGYKQAKGAVQLNIYLGNPVTINLLPQNMGVVLGAGATFTVGAIGSTPVSYAWQFNGKNLPNATNSTLTITNALLIQTGTYTVTVSNPLAATNVSATLAVLTPPLVTNTLPNPLVPAGTNLSITCPAEGLDLGFQWLFDNAQIPAGTNVSLVLTNVQPTNAGSYVCIVSNIAGALTSSVAMLTVETAPVILVQPLSHTVPPGGSTAVSVVASGTPAPGYRWIFNGGALASNTNSLALNNFQSNAQGTYAVIVSNLLGSVTSSNAILTLDSPLRLAVPSLAGGAFDLQLIGPAGSNYIFQASTDLITWISLLTNNASNGYLNFSDTNAVAFPQRFYRAVGD